MTTRVIHVNDMTRYPDAVYVGRANPRRGLTASPLANPFKITEDVPRLAVIRKYAYWLTAHLMQGTPEIVEALIACRDKPIACWCRHAGQPFHEDESCHGDIIAATLERWSDDELRAMKQEHAA